MSDAPQFLTASPAPRLLFFGGKGGVGKTTCAAAAALQLVKRADAAAGSGTVLLVSTDPAHSLKDSLAGATPPAGLEVVELRAQERLDDFKRRHGEQLRQIAERGTFLDAEDINRFLSLSLPGMDELVAFLDLAQWAEENAYGCIVVDTAPTGHTLRLLAMPQLLRRWAEVLDAFLAKHRYMRQLFGRSAAPDPLDRFLEELGRSIDSAEALFRDRARCRFVPVMIAEELSVRETAGLLRELDRHGIAASEIVVNKLAPADAACPVCADMREHQLQRLRELRDDAFQGRSLWGVPLQPQEVRGAQALEAFWAQALPLDPSPRPATARTAAARTAAACAESLATAPRVESPAPLPSAEMTLLFFAGKGGVGKTTLACATAMRLARERRPAEVLLFSTDPAHSLADCLGVPVGPNPARVAEGLMAMEIDAEAELAALKDQYRRELDEFLASVLKNLDAPFDREVMERMLDLSPPGLDEIMALARAMELLDQHAFGLFVLDSAPTGHLIRLLEMPEIVDQWLKAFFEVFLKYRHAFRMPRLSERLVELSKALRRFRALLRDARRSGLAAVSILTEMALEETKDLVAACERMQVSVPLLFLNMATQPSGCPFCSARARQEAQVRDGYRRAFERLRDPTVVYWQPEPRGLGRVEALGRALYQPPRPGSATPEPTSGGSGGAHA